MPSTTRRECKRGVKSLTMRKPPNHRVDVFRPAAKKKKGGEGYGDFTKAPPDVNRLINLLRNSNPTEKAGLAKGTVRLVASRSNAQKGNCCNHVRKTTRCQPLFRRQFRGELGKEER